MVKVKLGDDILQSKIRFKVRFDFKGEYKPGRFLFGGKSVEQVAEESRRTNIFAEKHSCSRNFFIDYDISSEPYVIYDESLGEKVAYAPAEITLHADSVEDIIRFVMREEFEN